MNLTEKDVLEFQKIYLEEFGKQIELDKAKVMGINLLQLIGLITKKSQAININSHIHNE